jgi:hypothetical protein
MLAKKKKNEGFQITVTMLAFPNLGRINNKSRSILT